MWLGLKSEINAPQIASTNLIDEKGPRSDVDSTRISNCSEKLFESTKYHESYDMEYS